MNLVEFSLILLGVLLNAVAQLFLKAGAKQISHFSFSWDNVAPIGWTLASNIHIWGGLCCYAVSVVVWIMALSRVNVSIAYPMLSIGYVVNALFAWWLFGEILTTQRMAGIAVIIVGVILVARS